MVLLRLVREICNAGRLLSLVPYCPPFLKTTYTLGLKVWSLERKSQVLHGEDAAHRHFACLLALVHAGKLVSIH